MKTKLFKILPLVVLLSTMSCKDQFLEVDPVAKYLEENYYTTEEQAFNALVAAYDPLQWTMNGGYWVSPVMFGEIRSDNANAGGDASNNDQPGWQEFDDFSNTALTNESQWIWNKCYAGIYRANLVLNNIAIESATINRYKAEAKFLRAYYHFDAFRHYGPTVVLDHVLSPDDYSQSRSSMRQNFEFMVKDLEESIPLLSLTDSESTKGRITKGAAQALLGKIYLYWADLDNDDVAKFDKAADAFRAVVDGGQYQLLDDFDELFAYGTNNSVESVFEIQHSNISPSNWDWPNSWIDGNVFVQLCGVRSLCAEHPTYKPGWGFMLPTQNLYDSFLPDDFYRRDAAILSVQEIEDDIEAVSPGACNGSYVDMGDQNMSDYTGYWQEKYPIYKSYSNPNSGDVVLTIDANEYVIRYADVLLMFAEALHRGSGNDAEAETYIDMVRERAAGPGDNTGSFRTVSQLMSDEGWTLLEAIWYERRAELAGEGDRWYDLVRSGRANSNLFTGDPVRSANFSADDEWIPIAQKEIDVTNQKLTAYPDASLFQ
ncbi:MAG: RagB/SusD family nutrient uptake outer membrane protein [Cyclobacteriaceae bacterium]|nr:RagB/SusD family nutrient uptake outer membrane protein [Cyclobacteriaceae bacterium]